MKFVGIVILVCFVAHSQAQQMILMGQQHGHANNPFLFNTMGLPIDADFGVYADDYGQFLIRNGGMQLDKRDGDIGLVGSSGSSTLNGIGGNIQLISKDGSLSIDKRQMGQQRDFPPLDNTMGHHITKRDGDITLVGSSGSSTLNGMGGNIQLISKDGSLSIDKRKLSLDGTAHGHAEMNEPIIFDILGLLVDADFGADGSAHGHILVG